MSCRNFVCVHQAQDNAEEQGEEGRKNDNESDSGSESKSGCENMRRTCKVSAKVRDASYKC